MSATKHMAVGDVGAEELPGPLPLGRMHHEVAISGMWRQEKRALRTKTLGFAKGSQKATVCLG